ncbi:gamma-glutamylcyclotransferase [Virgibacillus byunsanensis]|uniref:Gamma-glutamylcyclotransferase n=1 Tax=Virgibacillus byunsanensis TaxID=570945 RepID=A0ABW3LLM5_9BACI
MNLIFVYGTLRQGERNHHYLEGSRCIYMQAWVNGQLFDTSYGYPIMKPSDSVKVFGEVYEVTDAQFDRINDLEGYIENGSDNLYERVPITVYNDKGNIIEAITYVSGRSLEHSIDDIPFGDWKVFQYLQQENLLYFAYGSCMDDERFKLANVHALFKAIEGKGMLDGHGLRFSKSTSDGGKADIIESKEEYMEGVVYKISMEALDYLYKREGVYNNGYRPAVITIELNGKAVEALTFIGITKMPETKPTVLYATEIIRGATGILNESYINMLQTKIDLLMK